MNLFPYSFIGKSKRFFSFKKLFYIIAYHNIVNSFSENISFDIDNVSCTVETLENHIKFFKSNFSIISYSDIANLPTNYHFNKPPLVITFDDGYKSFYSIALPILKKYNCPATVFIPTSFVGCDRSFWWDKISFYVNSLTPNIFFKEYFSDFFIADTTLSYHLNDSNYALFHSSLISYFKKLDQSIRSDFFNFIHHKAKRKNSSTDLTTKPASLIMNWDQIKEAHNQGIEFGSHSQSHIIFDKLDATQIDLEIFSSIKDIHSNLGYKPNKFCFPGGKIGKNAEITSAILQKHGIQFACTMDYGVNNLSHDPFFHKRIAIDRFVDQNKLYRLLYCHHFLPNYRRIKNFYHKSVRKSDKAKIAFKIIKNSRPNKKKRTQHQNTYSCLSAITMNLIGIGPAIGRHKIASFFGIKIYQRFLILITILMVESLNMISSTQLRNTTQF